MTIKRRNFDKFLATVLVVTLFLTLIPMTVLDVNAQSDNSFVFNVKDELDVGIASVDIIITLDDDIDAIITDENGQAVFENPLPDTQYFFTASKEGYEEYNGTFTTDENSTGNYDIILASEYSALEGIVTFEGDTVAGARIILVGQDDVNTLTDENGEFALNAPQKGVHTVTVIADGYKVRQYEVDSSEWNEIELAAKEEQDPLSFEHGSVEVLFGQTPMPNILTGGSGNGEVAYQIEDADDNKGIAIIDSATGDVTIIGVGTVKVIATKSGDDEYNSAVASYILDIKYSEFWYESFFINGSNDIKQWYKDDVIISSDDGFLISHTEDGTEDDEWLESVPPITEEGKHTAFIRLKRKIDNAISVMEEFQINIDKTSPSNIQIDVDNTTLNKSSDNIDYHRGAAEITISAIDETSGIREFRFKHGNDERIIKPTEVDGDVYSASIKTLPNNSGRISITAVDNAGNISEQYESDRVVITDNIKPKLEVKSSIATRKIGDKSYYNKNIVVEVKVTEKNFNTGNVIAKVSRNGGAIEWWGIYDWTNSGDSWVGTLTLTGDAEYVVEIEYEDESGNKAQPFKSDTLIIDKTRPVINISFNDSGMKNQENGIAYFDNGRRATITIHERNFDADDVKIDITAKDSSGDDIEFKAPTGWRSSGDAHTLTVNFDKDANYQLGVRYTDLVGNSAYNVPKEVFTVDKSPPKLTGDNIVFRHKNDGIIAKFINFISFGYFSKQSIEVTITATDEISGVESITYYIVGEDGKMRLTDDIFIKNNSKNKSSQVAKFELKPDFKGYIYVKSRDFTLNESNPIKSQGLIVESTKMHNSIKDKIVITPRTSAISNDVYNGDFIIDVSVRDDFSGINNIEYTIGSSRTQRIDFTQYADVTYSWAKSIKVKAKDNNNNNVVVNVKYTDNAGYSNEETKVYKIDITKPVIDIEYSRDISEQGGYINSDLVATISIDELNFSAKDTQIIITKDGKPVRTDKTKWTSRGNTHTAKVNFIQDGEYTITARSADLASNRADFRTVGKFTIDKTTPTLQLTYDNNNATNGNYYDASRRATLVIDELNFNSDNVMLNITAKSDGRDITPPALSGWSKDGNKHSATIDFAHDALYEIEVSYIDMAGNSAPDIPRQTFYVDKTAPLLEISGVGDRTANNGSVMPVISYSDVNLDAERVSISLIGANRGKVDIQGSYVDVRNGRIFTFNDFDKKAEIDDIYTLTAIIADKAGNEIEQSITFSVNRFGSTYKVSDSTNAIIDKYIQQEVELEIIEINVDSLSKYDLKYSRNGVVFDMIEGQDYTVVKSGSDGEWKEYTYRIHASNFTEEGNYIVTIYSEDRASNSSDNKSKKKEIRFSVDKTAPICTATGIESNAIYNGNTQRLAFNIRDNIATHNVKVLLDGELFKEWEGSDILVMEGDFELLIPSANFRRKLEIIYTDKAGNTDSTEIDNFLISTNAFIRYYANKPLFFSSIFGIISFIVATTLIIYRKKTIKAK